MDMNMEMKMKNGHGHGHGHEHGHGHKHLYGHMYVICTFLSTYYEYQFHENVERSMYIDCYANS